MYSVQNTAKNAAEEPDGADAEKLSLSSDLMKNFRWLFAFSVAANVLLLAMPIHMIAIYDRVLTSRSQETLLYITLMAVIALVLLGITEAVRMMIAQRSSAKYVTVTAGALFGGLVHADSSANNERSQLLRDFYSLRSFLAGRAMIGLFDIPFTPLFLALLFALHVQLGVITLFGIIILAGLAYANRYFSHAVSEEATRTSSDAVSFSQSVLSRNEDIRAMGLFPAFLKRWGGKMNKALNHADETARVQAMFFGISRSVRQILQIIIMAMGAYLVLDGSLSGGVIFAASLISSRAFVPVEQVIGSWDQIVHAKSSFANLSAFIKHNPPQPRAVVPQMTVGDLEVQKVSFEVEAGKRVVSILRDISFSMKSGHVLAIIGPTGAGKSTLAKILSGAMKPTEGAVRLDDFDLTLWPDERRGESIGYVPQDAHLFPGTIAENISRFEQHPDEDRIIEAARKANVHSQIAKLPEAYATQVGRDSHEMSGGQQQQLALARAFYANPRVLVLDEPNAHLDQTAEDSLLRALALSREEGVSSIVVSQRRSILKVADYVLTLNDGRIASFKENHGQWRARRTDERADVPPAVANVKPTVDVQTLGKLRPRQTGQVRVEAS
ncbi:MAG: type I secretion system permease/ATPase [Pseudomonadota bacterium]